MPQIRRAGADSVNGRHGLEQSQLALPRLQRQLQQLVLVLDAVAGLVVAPKQVVQPPQGLPVRMRLQHLPQHAPLAGSMAAETGQDLVRGSPFHQAFRNAGLFIQKMLVSSPSKCRPQLFTADAVAQPALVPHDAVPAAADLAHVRKRRRRHVARRRTARHTNRPSPGPPTAPSRGCRPPPWRPK